MSEQGMKLLFIGGGNMAGAIIGGLLQSGAAAGDIAVIEPDNTQRLKLQSSYRVAALPDAASFGATPFDVVVWAVKPQHFAEAARQHHAAVQGALQLSVMAGVRVGSLQHHTGMPYVVRTMPNTPALIGQGITGLYASAAVAPVQRAAAERVLRSTGQLLWLDEEAQLDAVTALSGSGPAYVFYVVEAMMAAAQTLGLSAEQGKQLALATFSGAAELARRSSEAPAVLRERVTSKGGTTQAALEVLQAREVHAAFVAALQAAAARARELGDALDAG